MRMSKTALSGARNLLRWLGRCVLFRRCRELDGLDDHLRRDVGLPRRTGRPDAATLLDMSRPGSQLGGRRR